MPKLKNDNWEMFAILLVGKHRGNRAQAYIEAYNKKIKTPKDYLYACQCASRLSSNIKVQDRIRELLTKKGLTAESLDVELLYLISQYEDYKTKLGAIKEGNAILGRTSSHNTQVNILNYEQFLINTRARGGTAHQLDPKQLQCVQTLPPENQEQEGGAYPLCPEWSAENTGEDNSGAIIEAEADQVNNPES